MHLTKLTTAELRNLHRQGRNRIKSMFHGDVEFKQTMQLLQDINDELWEREKAISESKKKI